MPLSLLLLPLPRTLLFMPGIQNPEVRGAYVRQSQQFVLALSPPRPSPWLCRCSAATLPACCLGNKHILNHPEALYPRAKATLVEPRQTSSGQKSCTPSDELRSCKSSFDYWTLATLAAARQSNPGHVSWVPFVETVPTRTYFSGSVSTLVTSIMPHWSKPRPGRVASTEWCADHKSPDMLLKIKAEKADLWLTEQFCHYVS